MPSETMSLPLSAVLFSKLQKDILTGEIPSGSKLTEQKVCRRYDVSRTPVREALRQLEQEGLIKNIPNRGAFVLGLSDRDIIDMFDLRAYYEIQAAKWAVERMTKKEMVDFEETFDFMEFYTRKKDTEKMLSINMNFHRGLYTGAHNRMLLQTLTTYQLYIKYTAASALPDPSSYLAKVLEEHRAVFTAVKARDSERAEAAMREHMRCSKARRIAEMNNA